MYVTCTCTCTHTGSLLNSLSHSPSFLFVSLTLFLPPSLSFPLFLPPSLPLSPPPPPLSLRVSLVPSTCQAIQLIRSYLGRETTAAEGVRWRKTTEDTINQLNLIDLNYALYRCDQEERDDGHGGGAYVVPGAGAFVYCGLEGIMSMMKAVRDSNDLGHPLCDNLRSGDWLGGYTVNRLRLKMGTKKVRTTDVIRTCTCMYMYACTMYSTSITCMYTCVHVYFILYTWTRPRLFLLAYGNVSLSLSLPPPHTSWLRSWIQCSQSCPRFLATSFPATSRPSSPPSTLG